MDSRATELIRQGDQLFTSRSSLMSLWQEIALNFYVIRADFTSKIIPGDDLASHLSTSYPMLAHRDMTNAVSTMLRRRGMHWFDIRTGRPDPDEGEALRFLEWATNLQYRAMYDRKTQFVRATKEGDADFAAFGQTVIYTDTNRDATKMLYRNYHLRDVAWAENAEGVIDTVHRKWKPTATDLIYDFKGKCHPAVYDYLRPGQDPYHRLECRHVMVPAERLNGDYADQRDFPFRSYFIDVDNQHVMEDVPSRLLRYVIPRWQTVSGSPYAYSPATIAALPDARLIQAMTYTLLDAAEKAVQPPMIAQAHMIKSDMELWAGGTTWVDAEYDERFGEALRPIPQDFNGLPVGMEMQSRAQGMIAEAFFLNKIALPPADREMTAYETAQRIQEYVRQALPLFEPMEQEYNGAICEMTFETLKLNKAFGNPRDMPQELDGADIEFKFISPLQEREERQSAQVYLETKALLAEAAAIDEGMIDMLDGRVALRDALRGAGAPANWLLDDDKMDEKAEARAAMQQQAALMDQMQRGGEVAEQLGKASKSLNDAGMDAEALTP